MDSRLLLGSLGVLIGIEGETCRVSRLGKGGGVVTWFTKEYVDAVFGDING
jgi:hypothetical protein